MIEIYKTLEKYWNWSFKCGEPAMEDTEFFLRYAVYNRLTWKDILLIIKIKLFKSYV